TFVRRRDAGVHGVSSLRWRSPLRRGMAPQSLRPVAASTPRYCGLRQASPTKHMFAPRHTSTCARFVKLPAAATVTVKTLEKRRSVTIRGASDDSLRPASQAVDPCPPHPAPR